MIYLKSFKLFENNSDINKLISMFRSGDISNIELAETIAKSQGIPLEEVLHIEVAPFVFKDLKKMGDVVYFSLPPSVEHKTLLNLKEQHRYKKPEANYYNSLLCGEDKMCIMYYYAHKNGVNLFPIIHDEDFMGSVRNLDQKVANELYEKLSEIHKKSRVCKPRRKSRNKS